MKKVLTKNFLLTSAAAILSCSAFFMLFTYARVSMSAMARIVLSAASAGVVCFFCSLFLASKTIDVILAPVKRITSRLGFIQKGDYNTYIDYPYKDDFSPLVGTINKLTTDITETVRERTYEKQKAEYILNNMSNGMLLVDQAGVILQYNAAVRGFFELGENPVGECIFNLIADTKLSVAVMGAARDETSAVFDIEQGGHLERVVSIRVTPIAGALTGGTFQGGAIITFTDVTQIRRMERLRSEFIGNVSHELKTPITSIKGFAELVSTGIVTDPDTIHGYMERIYGEAERMTVLIEDILRINRLDAGVRTAPLQPVNLASLSKDIFFRIEPLLGRKLLKTSVKGAATFLADPDDMRQLMSNLIENAVKYNRQDGQVNVHLSQDGNLTNIVVSDTGIGIPLEYQPRIFERFYRVDKGRSKQEGGTGLGLSIVKHIVGRYRGQIDLTSKVDVGTTIKITLPNPPVEQIEIIS